MLFVKGLNIIKYISYIIYSVSMIDNQTFGYLKDPITLSTQDILNNILIKYKFLEKKL